MDSENSHCPAKSQCAGGGGVTLGAEGLATEVTLERPLAAVHAQVHVQVVLLGEGVAAQVAHKRSLVSVKESR